MEHGILLSGADNIDFMIHGVFKYSFFGHEVWITTFPDRPVRQNNLFLFPPS